ncbi:MAG: AbrB/MazE/SpoVT family DNA-binding domain-containing protein [Propionibacteriaceae bacterium]|jgi:bifunctional DNA-binding transcriptional regulator/antitoxin component of YhaV-PrlF toxin-antitoxin module|nr:AbrB/MazE/SpoVT family DNA-binding domain-containing protein [Propionibacteriaceae bacterium]
MSDTYTAVMGDKGRVVIPAPLRIEYHWARDEVLVLIPEDYGVRVLTRSALLAETRAKLKNLPSLADEVIAEHRAEAARDRGEQKERRAQKQLQRRDV